MKKISTIKKSMSGLMLFALILGSVGVSSFASVANAATTWDTTGNYVIDMDYLGTPYAHNATLVQDGGDNLSGNGSSGAYTWVINSGSVTGDAIQFTANYTATPDAVTPQTVLFMTGLIAPGGTMSGTWSDNYSGGERAGTWTTSMGVAVVKPVASVTTNAATAITATNATLNGTNASTASTQSSFWASTSTFSTAVPVLPPGVYSTVDLGPQAANAPFSALLSSVSGMPAITPSTTYYFAAWSNVNGTWTPGAVLNFTTTATEGDVDGDIGGDVVAGNGILAVTSIENTDSQATADGTFANGWEYVFNITIPTNEDDVAMKFADWVKTGGGGTIPAANNIRISSPQANNGGATVLITAANTYSVPTLHMITDLNPAMDGIQVKVTVEVAVPVGTASGSYTTSYGVNTN